MCRARWHPIYIYSFIKSLGWHWQPGNPAFTWVSPLFRASLLRGFAIRPRFKLCPQILYFTNWQQYHSVDGACFSYHLSYMYRSFIFYLFLSLHIPMGQKSPNLPISFPGIVRVLCAKFWWASEIVLWPSIHNSHTHTNIQNCSLIC